MLRGKTDLATRAQLKGMELAAGDRVLLLVALKVDAEPRAVLDRLRVTYRDAAGHSAEAGIPMHTRFRSGRCPGN